MLVAAPVDSGRRPLQPQLTPLLELNHGNLMAPCECVGGKEGR